jgi:predicted nucleic acid-binding protein
MSSAGPERTLSTPLSRVVAKLSRGSGPSSPPSWSEATAKPGMPVVVDVVCDASVVLKWFHAEGEEEVGESRALLDLHRSRRAALSVLDLTMYEVGNALMRGMRVPADRARVVIEALDEICPRLPVTTGQLADALALAERHGLTVYDAVYASVALSRHARLATLDRLLLKAGLGERPSEIVSLLA